MEDSRKGPLPPALYVNFLRVAHQRAEFFLTFGQFAQEQAAGAHLVASLVTSPAHAKSMLRALQEAVERHEQRFGEISLPEPSSRPRPAAGPPVRRAATVAPARTASSPDRGPREGTGSA